jgi:hypothetical protein
VRVLREGRCLAGGHTHKRSASEAHTGRSRSHMTPPGGLSNLQEWCTREGPPPSRTNGHKHESFSEGKKGIAFFPWCHLTYGVGHPLQALPPLSRPTGLDGSYDNLWHHAQKGHGHCHRHAATPARDTRMS